MIAPIVWYALPGRFVGRQTAVATILWPRCRSHSRLRRSSSRYPYLSSLIRGYDWFMKIKPETAETVLLGEIGVAFVVIGYLAAALAAPLDKSRVQERITIMKVKPVPIDPHAGPLVE